MGSLKDIVDRPVKVGARLIALRFIDEAEGARERFREGSDPEALHDLRVALRRLRSSLRAYEPYLAESVRARDRKRLKQLATATSLCRDCEVQLAHLRAIEPASAEETTALEWLVEHVEKAKAKADAHVTRVVEAEFPRERARLSRRLSRYTATLNPEKPDAPAPGTGEVAAGLAMVLAAELEARLTQVHAAEDQRAAHDARIAGKRLRYVLEPFRAVVPQIPLLIERLRTLQDDLGDMHDDDVLAEQIEALLARPVEPPLPEQGLRTLLRRLQSRRDERFEKIRKDWLGAAGAKLHDDVRAIAQQLRGGPAQGESRRRFLLRAVPSMRRRNAQSLRIDQGWLPGDALRERIRRERGRHGERFLRTVKGGKRHTRVHIEEELSREDYLRLWRLTTGRRISKRRWIVADRDCTWHIDRFLDRDVVIAEAISSDERTELKLPPWLAPHVVRDITDEKEFGNYELATQPQAAEESGAGIT
jgi:CHAD domain-containing protein/CYTH domain-containing protein